MPKPIATISGGVACAFPNVCMTPVPGSAPVAIPYPNIGQLSSAGGESTVKAGGHAVITTAHSISTTSGSEAGTNNNTKANPPDFKGEVKFDEASSSVKVKGEGVVRLLDATKQNNEGAVGKVLGGFPTVLVGD